MEEASIPDWRIGMADWHVVSAVLDHPVLYTVQETTILALLIARILIEPKCPNSIPNAFKALI